MPMPTIIHSWVVNAIKGNGSISVLLLSFRPCGSVKVVWGKRTVSQITLGGNVSAESPGELWNHSGSPWLAMSTPHDLVNRKKAQCFSPVTQEKFLL